MQRRFLYQFFLVVAAVVIVSSGFYFIVCKGLRETSRDNIGKFNYLINDTTHYTTLFAGASSIHSGINPFLFDSITGSRSFNAGMDGICITEMNLVVNKFIKSHGAPENIFINLDEVTLANKEGVWSFPQYYPYVNDPDFVDLLKHEPKLLFGKYFPPAAVTYFDDPLKNLGLIGFLGVKTTAKGFSFTRGYEPFPPVKNMDANLPESDLFFEANEDGWATLEKTLQCCQKNKVHVFITNTPKFNSRYSASSRPFFVMLSSLAKKYNATIVEHSTDTTFSTAMFRDKNHVNCDGANLLTTLLAQQFLKK